MTGLNEVPYISFIESEEECDFVWVHNSSKLDQRVVMMFRNPLTD